MIQWWENTLFYFKKNDALYFIFYLKDSICNLISHPHQHITPRQFILQKKEYIPKYNSHFLFDHILYLSFILVSPISSSLKQHSSTYQYYSIAPPKLEPIKTDVTRLSFISQAMAICANDLLRSVAVSFSDLICCNFSSLHLMAFNCIAILNLISNCESIYALF